MPTVVPHSPVGIQYAEDANPGTTGEVRTDTSHSESFFNPNEARYQAGELEQGQERLQQEGQYQRGELANRQQELKQTAQASAKELALRAIQIQTDAALRGETIQQEAAYRLATTQLNAQRLSDLQGYRGQTIDEKKDALGARIVANMTAAQQRGEQIDMNAITKQSLLELQQGRESLAERAAAHKEGELTPAEIAAYKSDADKAHEELTQAIAKGAPPEQINDLRDEYERIQGAFYKASGALNPPGGQSQPPAAPPASGVAAPAAGAVSSPGPVPGAGPVASPQQIVPAPAVVPGPATVLPAGSSPQATAGPRRVQLPPGFFAADKATRAKFLSQNAKVGDVIPGADGQSVHPVTQQMLDYYNSMAGQSGGQ